MARMKCAWVSACVWVFLTLPVQTCEDWLVLEGWLWESDIVKFRAIHHFSSNFKTLCTSMCVRIFVRVQYRARAAVYLRNNRLPLRSLKNSLRFDEQAATIPWFFRAAMVPLLNPFSSQQFLVPHELEVAVSRWRTTVCVWGEIILFIKPSSLLFLLPLISQKEKGENSVYHIQSSEQVNVHIKLNFRAFTEDRWLGGDGSKTQVNHKGCPPPPAEA